MALGIPEQLATQDSFDQKNPVTQKQASVPLLPLLNRIREQFSEIFTQELLDQIYPLIQLQAEVPLLPLVLGREEQLRTKMHCRLDQVRPDWQPQLLGPVATPVEKVTFVQLTWHWRPSHRYPGKHLHRLGPSVPFVSLMEAQFRDEEATHKS